MFTCPPTDACPAFVPEDTTPCTLSNPAAGELRCTYDTCPAMLLRAVCNDVAWSVVSEPCPGY
ncbi:MAG: hypothetical protein JRH11_11150 [Deltaproteobacteria bacterium]|nr:hypothetical protein [Deltaproteobacteria bacterium]